MQNEYSDSRLEPGLKVTESALEPLPSGNDPAYLAYTTDWNWGAFLLNCFWLPFFRMDASSIVMFVVNILFCGIPSIFVCYSLGRNGGSIAWKYRKFKDVQEYKDVLKKWNNWGIAINVLIFLFLLIFFVAIYFAIEYIKNEVIPGLGIL